MLIDYGGWERYVMYHHAVKLNGYRFFNVFILDGNRYEIITEGAQEQAMKSAFQKCLRWLEKFIDTNATFVFNSNAMEVATIQVGNIAIIDAEYVHELDEVPLINIEDVIDVGSS